MVTGLGGQTLGRGTPTPALLLFYYKNDKSYFRREEEGLGGARRLGGALVLSALVHLNSQRPYAMLKAPVPSITVVKQH
jgi:hypothetical protein